MAKKPKERIINFRVSDEEGNLIDAEANIRKLTPNLTARIVLLETLSGFDQKQETFLRRLDKLEELLGLVITLSSLGVATGALPFDAELQEAAALREKLKAHLKNSSDLGKNILEMVEKGRL